MNDGTILEREPHALGRRAVTIDIEAAEAGKAVLGRRLPGLAPQPR